MSKQTPHAPRGRLTQLLAAVKANAPTLLIGADQRQRRKRQPKAAAKPAAENQPLPQALPQKFSPLVKKAASPLVKGKKMKAKNSGHRSLFAFAAIMCLAFGGGYALHRSLAMPKVHVKHVAKVWLDQSAGKKAPTVRHQAQISQPHVAACQKQTHTVAKHTKKHKHKKKLVHKKHKKTSSELAKAKNHTDSNYQPASYSRTN